MIIVPAHAGGVDLSSDPLAYTPRIFVPAHAGGVDLSEAFQLFALPLLLSPPMRAGWI